MRNANIGFWVCFYVALFDAVCAWYTLTILNLPEQSKIFIGSCALCAVGMISNYMLCKKPKAKDEE